MATLNWQNVPQAEAVSATNPFVVSASNPWFAISMGLVGLIIGFALNRFMVPTTLGAQVTAPPPAAVQGLVVQPSPTPPPLKAAGGGCGCGGAGGACGAALAPTPVPNS